MDARLFYFMKVQRLLLLQVCFPFSLSGDLVGHLVCHGERCGWQASLLFFVSKTNIQGLFDSIQVDRTMCGRIKATWRFVQKPCVYFISTCFLLLSPLLLPVDRYTSLDPLSCLQSVPSLASTASLERTAVITKITGFFSLEGSFVNKTRLSCSLNDWPSSFFDK